MQKRLNECAKCAKLLLKSCKQSNLYRSCLSESLGYREACDWLDACIGLGCYPSTNDCHWSFVNSDKVNWKAATHVLKNSSNTNKTKYDCICYLFELYCDLMSVNEVPCTTLTTSNIYLPVRRHSFSEKNT